MLRYRRDIRAINGTLAGGNGTQAAGTVTKVNSTSEAVGVSSGSSSSFTNTTSARLSSGVSSPSPTMAKSTTHKSSSPSSSSSPKVNNNVVSSTSHKAASSASPASSKHSSSGQSKTTSSPRVVSTSLSVGGAGAQSSAPSGISSSNSMSPVSVGSAGLSSSSANPTQTSSSSSSPQTLTSTKSGFFQNHAAVAGVFIVVGLLALALICVVGFYFCRRRRQRRSVQAISWTGDVDGRDSAVTRNTVTQVNTAPMAQAGGFAASRRSVNDRFPNARFPIDDDMRRLTEPSLISNGHNSLGQESLGSPMLQQHGLVLPIPDDHAHEGPFGASFRYVLPADPPPGIMLSRGSSGSTIPTAPRPESLWVRPPSVAASSPSIYAVSLPPEDPEDATFNFPQLREQSKPQVAIRPALNNPFEDTTATNSPVDTSPGGTSSVRTRADDGQTTPNTSEDDGAELKRGNSLLFRQLRKSEDHENWNREAVPSTPTWPTRPGMPKIFAAAAAAPPTGPHVPPRNPLRGANPHIPHMP